MKRDTGAAPVNWLAIQNCFFAFEVKLTHSEARRGTVPGARRIKYVKKWMIGGPEFGAGHGNCLSHELMFARRERYLLTDGPTNGSAALPSLDALCQREIPRRSMFASSVSTRISDDLTWGAT